MKTITTSKRLVSVLLALIMVVSMCTVAFVNTFAAETDTAETGDTTYYLKGTFNNWGATDAFVDGKVTLNLSAGTYSFKVNGSGDDAKWYGNNEKISDSTSSALEFTESGGDCTLKASGGTYTFTLVTTASSKTITVSYDASGGSSSGGSTSTWSLRGQMSNWDPGTASVDGKVTMNLLAGTYEFKIYNNGWLGNNGTINDTCSGWIFDGNGGNCILNATGGTYTFDFDTSTSKLTVTHTTVDPTDPTTPTEPVTLTTILFRDDTTQQWITDNDADIYISFDGGESKDKMFQTIDTYTGNTMWQYEIPEGTTGTHVKFYRIGKLEESWATWTATLADTTTGYYSATASGTGDWATSTFTAPTDITNYWCGVWVDTKGNGDVNDAVKWQEVGTNNYHIFLPSYTPDDFDIYTNCSFSINGHSLTNGTVNKASDFGIELNTQYSFTLTKPNSSSTGGVKLTFHKSKFVDSLLLNTEDTLWTETNSIYGDSASDYKDAIETSGKIYLYDTDGNLVNENLPETKKDETKLKKIKGRGNSSFEASIKLYGKYAYNFNLDTEVALVDNATPAKKWCLLANNVDHSMLRNTFAYNLANDIGLAYSPKTRHVDVYDNGEYLGAYTIIEKVEYGDDTLMNELGNLDDVHEGWYDDYNTANQIKDYDDYDKVAIQSVGTKDDPKDYTTTSGGAYEYKYWTSKVSGFTYEHGDDVDLAASDFNFVLEHELSDRYYNEASWFKAPSGQYVVVKYPEFATQKEMKWAMEMYDKMHQAAYTTKTETALKAAIDVESFAKVYLIQELGLNLDACATSYYMYNQGGKLVAGPVWDYDWSFGSYHKTKVTYNSTSSNLSNPKQMYVKDKDIYNNISGSRKGQRNLQAQLTQTAGFWTTCQDIWTNDMVPAIKNYIDENTNDGVDTGIMLTKWLSDYNSSVEMNNIRWNDVYSKDEGALGDSSGGDGDWGTKLTANYDKGSYNFQTSSGTTSNSVGSSEYSYANTVYYLNDWLKVRMDYMSDDGGLYDESLVDPYKLNSVTLNATQSGAEVTVSVDFDATHNGTQIADSDKRFELYVNGELKSDHAITETPVVTLEENVETSIYVVAYLTDDPTYNMTSKTEKFTYEVTGPEYKVDNVTFTAVQSDDESTVTVTPSATVTLDGVELADSKKQYTIYLNGTAFVTNTFETASVDVALVNGQVNNVYVIVTPVDALNISGTSITQSFSYGVENAKVPVTINFKSSGSFGYLPKIKVNGNDVIPMTKDTSRCIGKNASQTQAYYWYTAEVELELDKATNVTFTNSYSMNATIAVTPTDGAVYHFAVDNMNQGTEVVDLSQYYNTGDEHDQLVLNFKQSASHMVYSSANDPELATTSINGTVYKLGDSDGDNIVTVLDATTTQMALANKIELSAIGSAVSDYDLDGVSSIMDVTLTQTYLAQ